jgi:hypothetical protein
MSCLLQQDTNVRLHLRGRERCDDWALQENASMPGMSETHFCNGLGGRVLQDSEPLYPA